MDYADVVLAGMVAVFAVSISVTVAIGFSSRTSIGAGSLSAMALVLHALFVNPPTEL